MRVIPILVLLAAAGCAGQPKTIIDRQPIEVKVPVSAPCMTEKPEEVVPLRERLPRSDWDALTTDQREALNGAQAMRHKTYSEKLAVASAGCD